VTTPKPRLELTLEGPAAKGRLSVDHLATIAGELQKALRRLITAKESGVGRFEKEVEEACTLELVTFGPGSVQMGFELAGLRTPGLFEPEAGTRAVEKLLDVLERGESREDPRG
jgi:hypothetical protein